MDVDSREVARPELAHRADMHAHPHADLVAGLPWLGQQRTLRVDGGGDGGRGGRERHEEAVALGAELGAAVGCDRRAHQFAMATQQLVVGVTEFQRQRGRLLDIGKEQADRSGPSHASTLRIPRNVTPSPYGWAMSCSMAVGNPTVHRPFSTTKSIGSRPIAQQA